MYLVKFTGTFAFIKPWTAVRDEETFSQQFLTPSIVAGIERKLFPELLKKEYKIYKIKRHRLSYSQVSIQQEQVQPRGWNSKGRGKSREHSRPYAIIKRGVLLNPVLFLGFENYEDAKKAHKQHICLSRNEDILYSSGKVIETSEEEFNNDEINYKGFELIFENSEDSFMVGYNRLNNNEPMYGRLKVVGKPVKEYF